MPEPKSSRERTKIAKLSPVHAVREWLHRRKWVRKNRRMLYEADALVISHTKSGRTWLRVMISHLYHLKYGIPATELMNFDNLHQLNPHIPRIFFTRDTRIPTLTRNNGYISAVTDKKTLFLVRDPRDVAVSFYFHVCNRASDRVLRRKGIEQAAKKLPIYAFVTDQALGLPRVIEHFNRWHEEMASMDHTLIIKYEDMRADPAAALTQIIRFIDCDFSTDDIDKAVEFASFENLARKEKNGYFNSGRLAASDSPDENARKVRRGKIGGYRDYFSEEQNRYLDKLVHEQLDNFYEYS
ncbi:MAG: sulfotransferase [Gammaproteobacteria bacterium]|nr:sulfotransferase [Gammaproteobacteria bacterium]